MKLGGLKVLMLSSDRNILVPKSPVSERMKEYGLLVEELHIVLLSDSAHALKDTELSKNVWIYPTNSLFSFLRPLNASKIGKKIIFEKKFVRGESLITADSLEGGWAGARIKRRWRIPLELQIHADIFSAHFQGFQNRVRRYFSPRILESSDTIRTVTASLADRVSQEFNFNRSNISVLPIYIDKEVIEKGQIAFDLHARYQWRFILLAVSRLAPEKNLQLALEALALVRQKISDVGLVIVGSGGEERKLKALAKRLKIAGAVEFAGWQNELSSYYRTANAFIQTSFFEGYGLALVEASLSGLPVITTPVGIASELEPDRDAYIYPADRPDLFANGILDLIQNNFKRENLKINLKRTLESKLISKSDYMAQMKSNWEKTASKIKS